MTYDTAFHELLSKPIASVLSQSLKNVSYYILNFDNDTFLLEQPNKTGLYSIMLSFSDAIIEIIPGWHKSLRSANTYHHLYLTDGTIDRKIDRPGVLVNLIKIDASHSDIWHDAINKTLNAVEIYGIEHTPQAVCLQFSTSAVAVTIGYSGDVPYAGDGDEILIYQSNCQNSSVDFPFSQMTKLCVLSGT